MNNQSIDLQVENTEKSRVVIRLRTHYWHDKRGLHTHRSLMTQKRMSRGDDFLSEDADAVGAHVTIPRITKLAECPDGLYEVVIYDEKHDWETGVIDDYKFRLVPLSEPGSERLVDGDSPSL